MKYLRILLLFFLIHPVLKAQKDDESTLAFQPELDSVIIHAWSSGVKEVEVIMYPYHHENWKRNEKESASWIFLNDSIVKEKLQRRTYYGIKKGNHIEEYDLKNKCLVSYPSFTRDSSHFRIYERSIVGTCHVWRFDRSICDTLNDSCNSLTIYCDGARSDFRRITLSDSSRYMQYTRTVHDTTRVETETWYYSSLKKNHSERTEMWITKTYQKYCSCDIDTTFIDSYYTFDGKGRLSLIYRAEYHSCGMIPGKETDEMRIIYKEND